MENNEFAARKLLHPTVESILRQCIVRERALFDDQDKEIHRAPVPWPRFHRSPVHHSSPDPPFFTRNRRVPQPG